MTEPCADILCTVARRLAFSEPLRERDLPPPSAHELVVTVDYAGDAAGTIAVLFGFGLPGELAGNMLPQRSEDWMEVAAALETANVIAGNLVPLLHPSTEVRLSPPRVSQRPATPWLRSACIELAEGLLSVVVCAPAAPRA